MGFWTFPIRDISQNKISILHRNHSTESLTPSRHLNLKSFSRFIEFLIRNYFFINLPNSGD